MASKLRVEDINGCRTIGRRALRTISFREEDAKMDIWFALINLEHKEEIRNQSGGNDDKGLEHDGVQAIVKEACAAAHPKRIRLRVAKMYEDCKDVVRAESAYAAAAKKHKSSKQVWSAYVRFRLLVKEDVEEASEALQKGLKCLAAHKHLFVISRYAQDEFEGGSVERGRTIFEELIASYGAKRVDLWNVYIDKEVKVGELDAARNLFGRLTTLKLSTKVAKSCFKKWLAFEEKHGDKRTQQHVKAQAKAYIERERERDNARLQQQGS